MKLFRHSCFSPKSKWRCIKKYIFLKHFNTKVFQLIFLPTLQTCEKGRNFTICEKTFSAFAKFWHLHSISRLFASGNAPLSLPLANIQTCTTDCSFPISLGSGAHAHGWAPVLNSNHYKYQSHPTHRSLRACVPSFSLDQDCWRKVPEQFSLVVTALGSRSCDPGSIPTPSRRKLF